MTELKKTTPKKTPFGTQKVPQKWPKSAEKT